MFVAPVDEVVEIVGVSSHRSVLLRRGGFDRDRQAGETKIRHRAVGSQQVGQADVLAHQREAAHPAAAHQREVDHLVADHQREVDHPVADHLEEVLPSAAAHPAAVHQVADLAGHQREVDHLVEDHPEEVHLVQSEAAHLDQSVALQSDWIMSNLLF